MSPKKSSFFLLPPLGRASKNVVNFLGDMSPIRRGGVVEPPPSKKKSTFFRQNLKNIQHALKNLFF